MGHMLKNTRLSAGSHAIRLPFSTSTISPSWPENGHIRFNTDTSALEIYITNSWRSLGMSGTVQIVKDYFVGDDVETDFTMTQTYTAGNEASVLVFIGGVFQEPGVAYTVSGTTITFTSAPPTLIKIVILHNFNSTQSQ